MLALFISAAVVAVERFINKRRLKLHEVLSDVGWLTLIIALIEFAYLFFVETATLNFGSAVRPLWYTEWRVFKALLLEAAVGVMLILTSLWLESAGLHIELKKPTPRLSAPTVRVEAQPDASVQATKCDVEW
jgi:hypothetical protein